MAGADNGSAQELAEAIRAIQDRVRARHPSGSIEMGSVPLPDLTPILHARDRAEGKVAAIGTVNPRPGGPVNAIIQAAKRLISRALDWHVREQVEFNRAAVDCIETLLTTLNEYNRTLVSMAADFARRLSEVHTEIDDARREAAELRDIRVHWSAWRVEWERKLATNEIQFLRSVADLQAAYQHRASLMEANFRDLVKSQHTDFEGALERANIDIQKHLWDDLEKIREEYERLIHNELRVVRQRAASWSPEAAVAPSPRPSVAPSPVDWLRFADRFRGTYEYVKQNQRLYVPRFAGRKQVLDIGCGRGEFLDLMKEAGAPARGIDLSEECVALCRERGFEADVADLFEYLAKLPEGSLDGIFSAQVVEHLSPERLPEMIRLSAGALSRGGILAIETPNPECLAIYASHFYIDPTHTRPVPPALLVFYLEEAGFGRIEVERISPAVESMPAVRELPEAFRDAFFNGLDYAVTARKL